MDGWVDEYRVTQYVGRLVKTKFYSIICNFVPCFYVI